MRVSQLVLGVALRARSAGRPPSHIGDIGNVGYIGGNINNIDIGDIANVDAPSDQEHCLPLAT